MTLLLNNPNARVASGEKAKTILHHLEAAQKDNEELKNKQLEIIDEQDKLQKL